MALSLIRQSFKIIVALTTIMFLSFLVLSNRIRQFRTSASFNYLIQPRTGTNNENSQISTRGLEQTTRTASADKYKSLVPCTRGWHKGKTKTVSRGNDTKSMHNFQPLLVLFTSFKNVVHRNVTHSNTVINWARYAPDVVPVLFNDSTDPYLLNLAKDHGWTILTLHPKGKNEAPRLRYMFRETMNAYPNCLFVGFCNGDILFDQGLLHTVNYMRDFIPKLNRTLVIGGRYNVKLKNRRITTNEQIRTLINTEMGKPLNPWAEDYFLLARSQFPWHKFPETLVIGRPAYDNFLVAIARQDNMSVVDASCTVGAMHQMGHEGVKAGFMNNDSMINKNIIKQFNYRTGIISKANYFTLPEVNGTGIILKRHA